MPYKDPTKRAAYQATYKQSEVYKAKQAERVTRWNRTPKGKLSRKASAARYRSSPKGKLYRKTFADRHRQTEEYRENLKRYEKSEKYKAYQKSEKVKAWRRVYYAKIWKPSALAKHKFKVRRALQNAVSSGKIQRPETCSSCGVVAKVEGHHCKGYAWKHRFNVEWLCSKCHDLIHIS